MKIFLANDNISTTRLVRGILARLGEEAVEVTSVVDVRRCDLLIVDDGILEDENDLDGLAKRVIILAKNKFMTRFDLIKKPFLPTELSNLIRKKIQEIEDEGPNQNNFARNAARNRADAQASEIEQLKRQLRELEEMQSTGTQMVPASRGGQGGMQSGGQLVPTRPNRQQQRQQQQQNLLPQQSRQQQMQAQRQAQMQQAQAQQMQIEQQQQQQQQQMQTRQQQAQAQQRQLQAQQRQLQNAQQQQHKPVTMSPELAKSMYGNDYIGDPEFDELYRLSGLLKGVDAQSFSGNAPELSDGESLPQRTKPEVTDEIKHTIAQGVSEVVGEYLKNSEYNWVLDQLEIKVNVRFEPISDKE